VIKSRRAAFTAFLTQIEENKNQWGAEVKSTKSKNRIFVRSIKTHLISLR
jgi:hypothetical protein